MQDRFTLYDVFAVLVPGVIFIYLLSFTLERAVGAQLFNWTGSIGDTVLLFIFGYAAGALLQTLGNLLIEKPWLRIRGGQPTATLLMPNSKKLSDNTKEDVLGAISTAYGQSSLGVKDEDYRKLLEDRTYSAWKTISPTDPQGQRFLAEAHAMRAFAASFLVLLAVTIAGALAYGDAPITWGTHGTLTALYILLFIGAIWRMENKAVTFARHVLVTFTKKVNEGKENSEQ